MRLNKVFPIFHCTANDAYFDFEATNCDAILWNMAQFTPKMSIINNCSQNVVAVQTIVIDIIATTKVTIL